VFDRVAGSSAWWAIQSRASQNSKIACEFASARAISAGRPPMARADANAQAIFEFCDARDWIANLAEDPATRSNTSVCLKFTDPRIADGAAFAKAVAKRLEAEGVALDIGAYRDAPAGLRIGCGATVETADIEAMLPWLDWAFHAEIAAQADAA
jgi:phosphoserine aminotransferase